MCGIFGVVALAGCRLERAQLETVLAFLFRASEARGKEAAGLAVRTADAIHVHKCAQRASQMLRLPSYRNFLSERLDAVFGNDGNRGWAVIGHSRLVTNGAETLDDNNQPVATGDTVGVHNGIIVNDRALWAAFPELSRIAEVDTEVVYRLLDRFRSAGGDEAAALARLYQTIQGSASLGYLTVAAPILGLATNTGSLYTAENVAAGVMVFASERDTLTQAVHRPPLATLPGSFAIGQVAAGRGLIVPLGGRDHQRVDLSAPPAELRAAEVGAAAAPRPAIVVRKRADPASLRRCTRCILPETFPFITFDAQGVCSVCHSHQVDKPLGHDALLRAVEPYRSRDGSPDCIVAFSGGRDSAYCLHHVKRELGMNPIAYTYDWGMVTDIGRRNQARLVAALGVEHIIRSPDIRAKRRNIRLNLRAWMAQPDPGMIPLFSAGDKQFYHYGRQLRRETGVRLTFFGAGTNLERTEFKTGFCGVRESQHGMRLNAYSVGNKVKFLTYYLLQYLRNPRYINRSLPDTFLSYWSTYVVKDDFIYLYHYIPWVEAPIVDTLMREYGWEAAPDSHTTWRIDDAFTPFHNYIYHTVAGFSEHDTFRSNQIRAGHIGRDEALRLAAEENRPRIQAMREYADMVGINLEEAMLVINAIPKLYER